MKKNTEKYKKWKEYQNKKNLIIRTKRKKKQRKSNKQGKKLKNSKPNKVFQVPEKFSIIDCPEMTINFFNQVIQEVEKVRTFQRQYRNNFIRCFLLDMSNTNYITSDALMYLLSIIQNTRGNKILPIDWIGNFPKEENVKNYLKKSGFLKYMKTASQNIIQVDDNIQIKSGFGYTYNENNIEKDIRPEIIDFTCEKIKKDKKEVNYLMTILTEMITNIKDHAYQKGGLFQHTWYIFVENKDDKITYTFMDNGLGIPTTIKKSILEKIFEAINFENEYKYIETALLGVQKRSETGKKERGNGLPSIYEQALNRKISNFIIISNRAYYSEKKQCDITYNLNGTVFYWEIKKEEI